MPLIAIKILFNLFDHQIKPKTILNLIRRWIQLLIIFHPCTQYQKIITKLNPDMKKIQKFGWLHFFCVTSFLQTLYENIWGNNLNWVHCTANTKITSVRLNCGKKLKTLWHSNHCTTYFSGAHKRMQFSGLKKRDWFRAGYYYNDITKPSLKLLELLLHIGKLDHLQLGRKKEGELLIITTLQILSLPNIQHFLISLKEQQCGATKALTKYEW